MQEYPQFHNPEATSSLPLSSEPDAKSAHSKLIQNLHFDHTIPQPFIEDIRIRQKYLCAYVDAHLETFSTSPEYAYYYSLGAVFTLDSCNKTSRVLISEETMLDFFEKNLLSTTMRLENLKKSNTSLKATENAMGEEFRILDESGVIDSDNLSNFQIGMLDTWSILKMQHDGKEAV